MANSGSRRQKRFSKSTPVRFQPVIWIDGPYMYASCNALPNIGPKKFSELQELQFAKLVHVELRDKWNINSQNLTMDFDCKQCAFRINFNDDEEFIMVKLLHG